MREFLIFVVVLATVFNTGSINTANEFSFKITTKHDHDHVVVTVENDKTVFSVHSPRGIGQAVIEQSDPKWPESMILRLHLNGLERFQITNGKITLSAAEFRHPDGQNVRLWKDGHEDLPLDSKSPYWMEIRRIGGDGKPATAIPRKGGYLEMLLPKTFFEGHPKSVTLNWIDFYR
ncbi:MAG: hypothetical protein NTW75_16655 [Planctomycetales bacterium]|jgi:hypothetical protein|nr:hypothetical protein [Planctomycetales bacterium]